MSNGEEKQTSETEETEKEKIKNELAECKRQRDEYLAGWQRAKADFLNYKKEEAERLGEFARYHQTELISELIRILDSFDLALLAMKKTGRTTENNAPPAEDDSIEKGIYMIRAQLEDVLKKQGLSRIEVETGTEFNPAIMEAIAETESELPAGKVVEEIEAGYYLYDRVLRPARVKVSKGQKT